MEKLSNQKVRKCQKFGIKTNHLWSVCYCLIATAFQVYLIIVNVQRFIEIARLPWTSEHQPNFELSVDIILMGIAVIALPFFSITSFCQIGNFANDGKQLGSELEACSSQPGMVGLDFYQANRLKILWQHGPPASVFLHLLISFCLLFPRSLLQAKMIEQGFLSKEFVWRNDLDFILPYRDRLMIFSFLFKPDVTFFNSSVPLQESKIPHTSDLWLTSWSSLSPEYVNYVFANAVFTIVFPSVFWFTNRNFSILFCFQLFTNCLFSLILHSGFSVLYKIQMTGFQLIVNKNVTFLLTTYMTIFLYIVSCIFIMFSNSILYFYGYQKIQVFLNLHKIRKHVLLKQNQKIWGYWSHMAALLVLVAWLFSYGPLIYDWIIVYRSSLDTTVFSATISALLHLLIWIIVWFTLTVKYYWNFNLHVTVGKTFVSDSKNIVLVNEVETSRKSCYKNNPVLILGNGKTYTINDMSSKQAILNFVEAITIKDSSNLVNAENLSYSDFWNPIPEKKKKNDYHLNRSQSLKENKISARSSKQKVKFKENPDYDKTK